MERDPLYKLRVYIGSAICNLLTARGYKKSTKTASILGCTFDEFYLHIENLFMYGMSWENRNEWHIDHIVPVSFANTEMEIIKLNHYSNLRPLWKKDNLYKAAKLTEEAMNHPLYLEIIIKNNFSSSKFIQ